MITNLNFHKTVEKGVDWNFYALVQSERMKRGIVQFGERIHNNRETYYRNLHLKINSKKLSK